MITLPASITSGIASGVTTMASLWKITRTDSQVFGFTSHDRDIEYDGVTYSALTGYTRTAVSTDSSMASDSVDIEGVLDASTITEADLLAGVWDHARLDLMLIDWQTPTSAVTIKSGWLGEVATGNAGFKAELMGLASALGQNVTDITTPTCRADLGDARCGVSMAPITFAATVSSSTSRREFYASALPRRLVSWNPSDKAANVVLSNDNTTATLSVDDAWRGVRATQGKTTGKWYFEVFVNQKSRHSNAIIIGLANADTAAAALTYPGNISKSFGQSSGGTFYTTGGGTGGTGFSYTLNNIIGFAFDGDAHECRVYKDNVLMSTVTGVPAEEFFPMVGLWDTGAVVTLRAVASDQSYAPPSGYTAWEETVIPPSGYWVGGKVTWTSGANAGLEMEVKNYAAGNVALFLPMPYDLAIGDGFSIHYGCDKVITTCSGVFGNAVNFRGEPYLPGTHNLVKGPQ